MEVFVVPRKEEQPPGKCFMLLSCYKANLLQNVEISGTMLANIS